MLKDEEKSSLKSLLPKKDEKIKKTRINKKLSLCDEPFCEKGEQIIDNVRGKGQKTGKNLAGADTHFLLNIKHKNHHFRHPLFILYLIIFHACKSRKY